MSRLSTRRNSLCMALAALGLATGCNLNVTPGPEAVLEGTWSLTTSQDFGFTRRNLVFDSQGKLTKLQTVVLNVTIDDADQHKSTSVNGDHVRIETTGNLIFDGTFNSDRTVITGKLTSEFMFYSTTVTIDNGDAKLTKQ